MGPRASLGAVEKRSLLTLTVLEPRALVRLARIQSLPVSYEINLASIL
jgi:hypothetical protein